MIAISGYSIKTNIYESSSSLVYRASRNSDGLKVILKVLRHHTTDKIAKFKQEYEITRSLQHLEGVIKVWGWEQIGKNLSCMTLEDFGGESLKNLMAKRSFTLEEILSIGINLSETLGEIHAASIIHKDINPANILLQPETGEVKIIDFGIALLLNRENPTSKSPSHLEGTLPYISPEQTGRMNRAIDYRTDFYSLGVTFYELLTGRVPFDTQDTMELVHSHIAKQPVPPHEVNPAVPEPLSQLVMKLLAKTAEDRYQSAWGIKADLVLCLMQLEANGVIEELIPGDNDVSDKFQIPQKLYGREAEVAALLAALERASAGSQEMMLISGYSGIGKSSLVQEIYHRKFKGARQERAKLGYLITGKFDQYQRQVPYSGLVLAFSDLVRQLLMESDAQLQQWREKILAACGAYGQILIDVIPELELIIGKMPPLTNVGSTEAQSQFKKVLQKFIGVFCSPDRPLVIFLDDIQWADAATFNWLESMLADVPTGLRSNQTGHLLWIFAYQIRETVNPGHPLMKLLEVLQQKGMSFETIALAPLQVPDITQMIAETLQDSPEKVKPLAELVMSKTGGNPFFVTEFLKTLYQENLLQFNFQYLSWQWDSDRIQGMDITDNLVDLTVALLQKLPDATQELLRLAACIGESFDLTTLCYLQEKSPTDTLADLSPAINEGLILPDNSAVVTAAAAGTQYKFLHQKVQEAAGALIDAQWQKAVHFKIGRHLLQTTPAAEKHERLFEIVSHLNAGKDWLVGSREKVELARLNLEAGKKAKEATAYAAALEYFRTGTEILDGDDWDAHYDLTFTLYKELAEVEYLNGDLAGATKSVELTLSKVLGALDKAEICNLMMAITRMAGAYSASITAGKQGLQLLGVTVPEADWDNALGQEIAAINSYFAGQSSSTELRASEANAAASPSGIAYLWEAPEMSQPDHRCAAKLVMNLMETARWFHPELFAWSSAKLVSLSLQYGNAPESAIGYANYGVFLGTTSGAYREGRLFGKLAMRLSDKFHNIAYKCKVCLVVANYIIPWTSHLKHATSINNEGYQAGLESGNLQDAGYILLLKLMEMFFQGKTLTLINPYLNSCIKFLQKTGNGVAAQLAGVLHWAIEELKGAQLDSLTAPGLGYSSLDGATQHIHAFCQQQIIKTQILYLFHSYEQSLQASEQAAELLAYMSGDIATAEHNFYTSLTLAALYKGAEPAQKTDYWQRLEANQAQMQRWAESAAENFEHKYLLVAAEMARLSGQDLEAITLYDRAIESATKNEFIHIAAIASELAAEFWLTRSNSSTGAKSVLKYAKLHIMEARDEYRRWGANSKVEALEELYPQLLPTNSGEPQVGGALGEALHRSGPRMTTEPQSSEVLGNTTQQLGRNSRYLDLSAVLKASRAISSEIVMDKLLDNLMKILIENAGARKGFLLLVRDGNLTVSATATVETLEDKTGFYNDPSQLPDLAPTVAGKEAAPKDVNLPLSAINYVERTRTDLVLSDAAREGRFTADPYIAANNIKSLLCTPIINGGQLIGILYLENSLTTGAFTPDRLEMLRVLSSQAAISLENALLYASLEQKVAERTRELNEKNERLQKTLLDLQRAQAQLIQTEKMSSLGQMVAGVAHEINNPVNFIYGNVAHARDYVEDLLALLNLYRQEYPEPTPEIQQALEDTDLDFISDDLEKLLLSMRRGAERIRSIIISLRNFSRLDEAEMKSVDLHEGIDSTLLILQHKFKAENSRNGGPGNPAIMMVKEYGQLPQVTCYAAAINQVFMSIITNAIDALRSVSIPERGSGICANGHDNREPQITIRTDMVSPVVVRIRIADNGPGMTEDVLQKIFDPFFTTKPVGSGVGLGLSVSYSIVVDRHGGKLTCTSTPGVGTEFAIELPLKPM